MPSDSIIRRICCLFCIGFCSGDSISRKSIVSLSILGIQNCKKCPCMHHKKTPQFAMKSERNE